MIDSSNVLSLMKVVYSIYVIIAFSLLGIYAFGIISPQKILVKIKIPFYAWIGMLVIAGIGIHILTFHKIPWVKWDLNRSKIKVDKEINVVIADYKFNLPDGFLSIQKGQTVRFVLKSEDYTYGFGLFRKDGTMVFQMQVVPGRKNDLVWKFDKADNYAIRSTEYSGPKGGNIFVENAVVVAEQLPTSVVQSVSHTSMLPRRAW